MTSPNTESNRKWIQAFDNLLIPVAGALLCVLCVAQAVTMMPAARRVVDQTEGRFSAQSAMTSLTTQRAEVTLYLSPSDTGLQPQIIVRSSQTVLGELSAKPLTIEVRDGEEIELERLNASPSSVIVSVEHNNPMLLQPISGWSVTLTQRQSTAAMPTIRFAH